MIGNFTQFAKVCPDIREGHLGHFFLNKHNFFANQARIMTFCVKVLQRLEFNCCKFHYVPLNIFKVIQNCDSPLFLGVTL